MASDLAHVFLTVATLPAAALLVAIVFSLTVDMVADAVLAWRRWWAA